MPGKNNKAKKQAHILPMIAIIGRPNVGKSSLFNRLIQERVAVTYEEAGTTRDRIYHHLELLDLTSILIDTGGIEVGKKENIETDIQTQARLGIDEADLIIFVVNGSEPLTANDYEAAKILRRAQKNVVFVANKIDTPAHAEGTYEFYDLGFGEPILISTIHNRGIDQLEGALNSKLKKMGWKNAKPPKKGKVINVCFLGMPNAGKSSLVNAIMGENKLIVSSIAGTTRDAVDIGIKWQENEYNLIDTAGLRRRGKIETGLEKLSSFRSLEAIERSDVVCLVIDYKKGIGKQEQHISSFVLEAKKGLILLVNKTDLMENAEEEQHNFLHKLHTKFGFLPWVPALFVSALKHKNITKILDLSKNIYQARFKRIDQDRLEGFLHDVVYKHSPPKVFAVQPNIYSIEQDAVNPPTFVFMVNNHKMIHFSYKRYLENEIRKNYGFEGTSIRLAFRDKPRRNKRQRHKTVEESENDDNIEE